MPFDPTRNWPDLGSRFVKGENVQREAIRAANSVNAANLPDHGYDEGVEDADNLSSGVTGRDDMDDEVDLSWATVLKRNFEGYVRGDSPNAYGEWLHWDAMA